MLRGAEMIMPQAPRQYKPRTVLRGAEMNKPQAPRRYAPGGDCETVAGYDDMYEYGNSSHFVKLK